MSKNENEPKNVLEEGISLYEVSFNLLPTLPEEGVIEAVNKIKDIIKSENVFSDSFPAMISLAYPMDKKVNNKRATFEKAYFGWVVFKAKIEEINNVKESLDKIEEIIRFLLISPPAKEILNPRKAIPRGTSRVHTKKKEKTEDPIDEKELDKTIDDLVTN